MESVNPFFPLAHIEEKCTKPLRDPMGCADRYDADYFLRERLNIEKSHQEILDEMDKQDKGLPNRFLSCTGNSLHYIFHAMVLMHARGDDLEAVVRCLDTDLRYAQQLKNQDPSGTATEPVKQGPFLEAYQRRWVHIMVFPLLLLTDLEATRAWLAFFGQSAPVPQPEDEASRSYYVDLLVHAFVPDWPVVKNKHTLPKRSRAMELQDVMQALFRALAQPTTEARTEHMGKYMAQWNRMMKPYGWKPRRVFHPVRWTDEDPIYPQSDRLFTEFAFEAALAVCAYDLDDSGFRDHPYYPRDLVDHYRAHVRHTRDAWRPHGVGPGIAVEPPPLPKPLDLAKSKSKGMVRWVELVSAGDADATGAVIERLGKLRKVKDLEALGAALAENGAALVADIKDDETLSNQIDDLLGKRQLGEFDVSDLGGYEAGPGRCLALLTALDRWLEDKPHALLALDTQDDAWRAILVPRAHAAEFETLSASLGVRTLPPALAFKD